MLKSKRELFENARKRWPEEVRISDSQSNINNCIYTYPCLSEIYEEVCSSIDNDDNWNQLSAWSFHQAADKLGRRKYKNSDRTLRFKDVSFMSFNTMMLRNLAEDKWSDEWKAEREIYLKLAFEQAPNPEQQDKS
jgi:hypothetical protein